MPSQTVVPPTSHCHLCGSAIDARAVVCPTCGELQQTALIMPPSERRIVPALILCFVFGIFGAHRFYAGKIGTGILQLLTLGGLGIWTAVDFVMIVVGIFRDGDGEKITEWV